MACLFFDGTSYRLLKRSGVSGADEIARHCLSLEFASSLIAPEIGQATGLRGCKVGSKRYENSRTRTFQAMACRDIFESWTNVWMVIFTHQDIRTKERLRDAQELEDRWLIPYAQIQTTKAGRYWWSSDEETEGDTLLLKADGIRHGYACALWSLHEVSTRQSSWLVEGVEIIMLIIVRFVSYQSEMMPRFITMYGVELL
jgi:hypothetical protein